MWVLVLGVIPRLRSQDYKKVTGLIGFIARTSSRSPQGTGLGSALR